LVEVVEGVEGVEVVEEVEEVEGLVSWGRFRKFNCLGVWLTILNGFL
jgi:hypothetical protein